MKFYKCDVCGNVAVKVVEGAGTMSCCGQEMRILKAGTTDAALEKHVPFLTINGNVMKVQVGEVVHPMTSEHSIQVILAVQGDQIQYRLLTPDVEPEAEFVIDPSRPVSVYEYCNLHGLWQADK